MFLVLVAFSCLVLRVWFS